LRREEKVDLAVWEKRQRRLIKNAYVKGGKQKNKAAEVSGIDDLGLNIGPSPGRHYPMPMPRGYKPSTPVHQWHLENFFNAIRDGTPLTCPGEVGYETAVSVLRVNDALASGRPVQFKPEDFKV